MWEKDIARYQLTLPEQTNPDADGRTQDLTWMLPHFLHALSKLGFSDATIQPSVQGIWTDPRTGENFNEPMTRVDIDAPDTPENDLKLHEFSAEVARVTEQHKLYFVKHSLPRTLVDAGRAKHPLIDLPSADLGNIEPVFG
jgi:hypothetical protein